MKIFVYKSFIIITLIFLLYHLTIGYHINKTKIEFYKLFDSQKIEYFRDKVKTEILKSLKKERILSLDDANLLKQFINKLRSEINN